MKAGKEYFGVTGYRDPVMLTRGKLLFDIIQQFHMLRRMETTIIELCCRGRNIEEIVERVLCYQSMPKGEYLICHRSDTDWCAEKQKRIQELSREFAGNIQRGHYVAIASPRLKQSKTTSGMYSSFDLGKVQSLIEGSYSALMYRRLPSSSIYTPNLPNKAINVLHSEIRY